MRLNTSLPIASLFFKHWDIDDTEVGVIVAKARFQRAIDQNFWATAAPELLLAEEFDGDPASAPLWADQDIAPGKAATDLLIRAIARAPRGHFATDWPVSVSIANRLHYGFQVRGPTLWQPMRGGWRQSTPQPIVDLPISYALAYGGTAPGRAAERPKSHAFNPSGLGFATAEMVRQNEPFAAAQIGDLADFMTTDPTAQWMVHGFGPVAKAWLPRRSHAGTFDATWQSTRHPRMPRDYSYRFWNAAPGPLQLNDGVSGQEIITVTGVRPEGPTHVQLPGARLGVLVDNGTVVPMVLDTIEIDLRARDPLEDTLLLTWRLRLPDPHLTQDATIDLLQPA